MTSNFARGLLNAMPIRLLRLILYLSRKYDLLELTTQKTTARAPFSIIATSGDNKYLIVIAQSRTQKFYLERSVLMQRKTKDLFEKYFVINMPVEIGDKFGSLYVVYQYIDHLSFSNSRYPIDTLKIMYMQKERVYIDEDILITIKKAFLDAWPQEFHSRIEKLSSFEQYFNSLRGKTEYLFYEHGDFNVENVQTDGMNYYLFDYEFMKSDQTVEMDEYDYLTSLRADTTHLCANKSLLCDEINKIVDGKKFMFIRTLQKYYIKMVLNIINK